MASISAWWVPSLPAHVPPTSRPCLTRVERPFTCLHPPCLPQSRQGFYGRGAYFAERALYSHTSYAHCVGGGGSKYQLILAHVLCGRGKDMGTDTDETLVKPPSGYNSVHGGPHKTRRSDDSATASEMWVVYDRAQSYPAYIVTYASSAAAALR